MNNEFDWKTAEYPCFGIYRDRIVCFSSSGVGHELNRSMMNTSINYGDSWDMSRFKPYTKPTPKEKLWYWEVKDEAGGWYIYDWRLSELAAKSKFSAYAYRNLEALGYIEED